MASKKSSGKSSGKSKAKFGWVEVAVAVVGGAALGVVGTLMIRPTPVTSTAIIP
jgi:hypothetical protein